MLNITWVLTSKLSTMEVVTESFLAMEQHFLSDPDRDSFQINFISKTGELEIGVMEQQSEIGLLISIYCARSGWFVANRLMSFQPWLRVNCMLPEFAPCWNTHLSCGQVFLRQTVKGWND